MDGRLGNRATQLHYNPVSEYQMNPGQRLEAILIGIVNFGRKNCTTILITPTVFANVGFYRNWIDAKLQI